MTTITASAAQTWRRSPSRCCRRRTGRITCTRGATSRATAGSRAREKWLEAHGLQHWVEFYTDYGVRLQKRFFGHFLKGEDTGWDAQPPVVLQVRRVDGSFEERAEAGLAAAAHAVDEVPSRRRLGAAGYAAGCRLAASVFRRARRGTGVLDRAARPGSGDHRPAAARLTVASSTTDADLFLTLRVIDPAGRDVTFVSGQDPNGCVGFGWLRASHRETDPERSHAWRPWHTTR